MMKKILLVISLFIVSTMFVCLGAGAGRDYPKTRYWFKNIDCVRGQGREVRAHLLKFMVTGDGKDEVLHLMREVFEMQRQLTPEELGVYLVLGKRVLVEDGGCFVSPEDNVVIGRAVREQGRQIIVKRLFDLVIDLMDFGPELFRKESDTEFREFLVTKVETLKTTLGRASDFITAHFEIITQNPQLLQKYWQRLMDVALALGIQPGTVFDMGVIARQQSRVGALSLITNFEKLGSDFLAEFESQVSPEEVYLEGV